MTAVQHAADRDTTTVLQLHLVGIDPADPLGLEIESRKSKEVAGGVTQGPTLQLNRFGVVDRDLHFLIRLLAAGAIVEDRRDIH
ncbi:MAG TPA: hypothetical protein VE136_12015 [Anaerolineales bacterium]|jgi:hypothetical protein|nr:hypothetical protein [Anaerolineales bacterium]